jgi:ribonuclease VapC
MFVDASAIVAILVREVEGLDLMRRLDRTPKVFVSPLALYEAVLGVARIRNVSMQEARAAVDYFVEQTNADIVPIDSHIGNAALIAFGRFGKGRHPAGLNLGDCFAYACAKQLDVPLLCKGDDFPRTDIALA